jgi:hypothetical protein
MARNVQNEVAMNETVAVTDIDANGGTLLGGRARPQQIQEITGTIPV